jgi:hypothetical protein
MIRSPLKNAPRFPATTRSHTVRGAGLAPESFHRGNLRFPLLAFTYPQCLLAMTFTVTPSDKEGARARERGRISPFPFGNPIPLKLCRCATWNCWRDYFPLTAGAKVDTICGVIYYKENILCPKKISANTYYASSKARRSRFPQELCRHR